MIHITTQHHLHVWIDPIDFRKGLDSLMPFNIILESCKLSFTEREQRIIKDIDVFSILQLGINHALFCLFSTPLNQFKGQNRIRLA